jgi:hypothetical protein
VVRVTVVFASDLLRAIRFFQAGVLTDRVADSSVREAVTGVLPLDPELAQFIRTGGSGSNDDDGSGIIARMWPNMGTFTVSSVVTSSMAQYFSAK